MTHHPTFGELLGRSRRAAGLTQEALAARAGVSARAISDLERGVKHVPRRDTVRLLVAALPLSSQERALFEAAARRVGDPNPSPLAANDESGGPDASSPAPHFAAPPLVGRIHARAALARHLTGDGPPLLALTGEPGIGKTRLLTWIAERAAARGLRVLGDGRQLRDDRAPHEPLLDALRAYIRDRSPVDLREDLRGCAWLVRALPELGDGPIEPLPVAIPTSTPARERHLTAEAVARFLSNVAGPRGALLVLDDLHGAASADLDLLLALLRAATAIPLRVVAAYRDSAARRGDPLDALLAAVAEAQAVTRLTLPRLGPEDAAWLLDDLLRDIDTIGPREREVVARRADGVPFFIVAWARELRLGHDTHDIAVGVPWAIAQSIRRRIDAAPAIVRTALEVAAAADGPVTPVSLRPWVAGAGAADALDIATGAYLLRAADDGYRFAHELLRDVVLADLGPARRAALRERLEAARRGRRGGSAPDEAATGGERSVVEERRYHLEALMQDGRAGGIAPAYDGDDGGDVRR